jgi:DNA-binding response OmpR family regulator
VSVCDGRTASLRDFCNNTERLIPGHNGPTVHPLLFIEDDDQIRLALRMALEDEGYQVYEAPDGASGLAAFAEKEPELVLLDLRLPDMSGFDVCRALRAASIVPIIIITAQTDTYDMVAGLEAGADDYITKPVVPKQLAARIRALLRRVQLQESSSAAPRATRLGDVELRREQGIVRKAGREISLTKTEFRLLCEFADHAGAVLSRDQLLERVWLRLPRRLPPGRRPRPPPPGQDRGPPRRTAPHRHRPRPRLPTDRLTLGASRTHCGTGSARTSSARCAWRVLATRTADMLYAPSVTPAESRPL